MERPPLPYPLGAILSSIQRATKRTSRRAGDPAIDLESQADRRERIWVIEQLSTSVSGKSAWSSRAPSLLLHARQGAANGAPPQQGRRVPPYFSRAAVKPRGSIHGSLVWSRHSMTAPHGGIRGSRVINGLSPSCLYADLMAQRPATVRRARASAPDNGKVARAMAPCPEPSGHVDRSPIDATSSANWPAPGHDGRIEHWTRTCASCFCREEARLPVYASPQCRRQCPLSAPTFRPRASPQPGRDSLKRPPRGYAPRTSLRPVLAPKVGDVLRLAAARPFCLTESRLAWL